MVDHTSDPDVSPPAGSPTGWDPSRGWEHATLRRAAVHGVRLFNAGEHHGAHDCFELEWYNYGRGSTESAFCHGMVQIAAGAHKRLAHDSDAGLRSLYETALEYLRDVPHDFYGVDVLGARTLATNAIADPAVVDEARLRIDGEAPVATATDHAYLASIEE